MGQTISGYFPTYNEANGTKLCNKCLAWLPGDNFSKRSDARGCGYRSECNKCRRESRLGRSYSARVQRKWRANNRFKHLAVNINSNAKKQGASGKVTGEELEKRFSEVGEQCYICNLFIPVTFISFDHVRAIACGGENSMDNILPVHRGCNAAKGRHPVAVVLSWR